jgi:hypothetical protein
MKQEYERLSQSRWFRSFSKYVLKKERYRSGADEARVVLTTFGLLEELDVFECPRTGVVL